jgi:hypothetical protein
VRLSHLAIEKLCIPFTVISQSSLLIHKYGELIIEDFWFNYKSTVVASRTGPRSGLN